jgi:hypothetical protein
MDAYCLLQRRFFQPFETSPCPFRFPDQSWSMLDQFSRTGDFHTAMVKNAMKIVATVQMVRSFMLGPCSANQKKQLSSTTFLLGMKPARFPASPLSY